MTLVRSPFTWLRLLAVLVAIWSLWVLERTRSEVPEITASTEAGEVTLYGESNGPLVIVTHGFAGSTQMMQSLSRDLAAAGMRVAAFDFAGHGRSPLLMSSDVTRIEGTTAQLVAQTVAVTNEVRAKLGWTGPIALLGHSMATDIVIRAAQELADVRAIVAISMYSDAVTATFPNRLLILSGEWEPRLRDVALEAVHMVEEGITEGETAQAGDILRRAAIAPRVEHVGVLYSAVTLQETRTWIAEALDVKEQGQGDANGPVILTLLISVLIASTALARLLPVRTTTVPTVLTTGRFLAVALVPVLPAMAVAWFVGGAVLGVAAFGHLLVFFAVWGGIALALLARAGRLPRLPDPVGVVVLVGMCLIFALALDRYGASFVPAGPRLGVMLALALGTVPFMLADRMLLSGASLWRRVFARVLPIVALFVLMILSPQPFGLLFTVLPVLLLFYLVFGTMGRFVAARAGPETAGVALGLVLAWSIASSQPLFGAAM